MLYYAMYIIPIHINHAIIQNHYEVRRRQCGGQIDVCFVYVKFPRIQLIDCFFFGTIHRLWIINDIVGKMTKKNHEISI